MTLNLGLDFALGFVPILGDIADAAFRCNTKNVSLLEAHLKAKYGPADAAALKRSGLEPFDDDPDFTDTAAKPHGAAAPLQQQPQQQAQQQRVLPNRHNQPVPEPAGNGGKWYHFGSRSGQKPSHTHDMA